MTSRPWIDAWQEALYGRTGFYTGHLGPAGHFATSAQGIPGVSEILAQALIAMAEREEVEIIVDFACGRGELLTTLMQFGSDLKLMGVDIVERPPELDSRITWCRSAGGSAVPSLDVIAGRRALVVAHEWLDVVPCKIGQFDHAGVLREVLVNDGGEESLGQLIEATPLTSPELLARAPGERLEFSETRDAAWHNLVEEIRRNAAPGSLVLGIDYVFDAADPPPLGTLTGFREGTECVPVPDGSCDITSHVALNNLDLSTASRSQREVLFELFGEEPLQPVPLDLARENPLHYLERLSMRSAFATATDPRGLGRFAWFIKHV